jgi:hypothetical protein
MAVTTTIDECKLEAFMERFVGELGACATAPMVLIGDKLGLYKAMAGLRRGSGCDAGSRSSGRRYPASLRYRPSRSRARTSVILFRCCRIRRCTPTAWTPRSVGIEADSAQGPDPTRGVPTGSRPSATVTRELRNRSVCWGFLARPRGFEPLTFGSVDRRSIQLSYGRRTGDCRAPRLNPRCRPSGAS